MRFSAILAEMLSYGENCWTYMTVFVTGKRHLRRVKAVNSLVDF